jgi:hypothetical protein
MAAPDLEQNIRNCSALVYFQNKKRTNAGSGRCTNTPEACYLTWMQNDGDYAKVIQGQCAAKNPSSPEDSFQP